MKLDSEIKKRIDTYFAEISAEELYRISIEKYGFTEDNGFVFENQKFGVSAVELYKSSSDESYETQNSRYSIEFAA